MLNTLKYIALHLYNKRVYIIIYINIVREPVY